MPTTTADRLRQIMNDRHLKQVDILRMVQPYCQKYKIKLGKSDLSQFLSGKVKPGQWKLTILGLALNVSETWLMGLDVPMERSATQVDEMEKLPIQNGELSDKDRRFISWFHSLSPEKQRAILISQDAPEDLL